MNVIFDLNTYSFDAPLALSLGMFDGVHKGHQSILDEVKKVALEKGFTPSLLTFWPHPRLVFHPSEDLKLLNTLDEKIPLIGGLGMNYLFLQSFDEEFRNLSGEEFVKKILVEKLHVKYLIIGHDHVFGKNRSGNFELLQNLAPELGFEVVQMEAVNLYNHHISSTKVRNALLDGKINEANEMLGYSYPLSGKVIHGKKIGRTIGFPTANIEVDPIKLLPKKGAYIVDVLVDEILYKGMLSIGNNPTVGGQSLSVEVYIVDFSEDIYGKNIKVRFYEFLHDEIKFENIEALIDRLQEDEQLTKAYFATHR